MCRKFHGAAYATIGSVLAENFRWISGEIAVKAYTAENDTVRSFCANCGSSLFFSSPNLANNIIEVALGVFDDDIPVIPSAHIYVASGANWTVIADDLPKYEAGGNSLRLE
jgi:hypothetical protein